jgi:multiple sugar transport system substrate-binding protein
LNEYELLRVIAFLEKTRTPYTELIPVAEQDAIWNVLLFLIKQHVSGAVVTTSSLAAVAGVPYGTAMRRIHGLIEEGHVVKEPVSKTGKSFALHPSPQLLQSFLAYAKRIKALLAETYGYRKQQQEDEFYFGGSYFAAQTIPPPKPVEGLSRGRRELTFLFNDDNYFASMRNMWSDYRNNISSASNFQLARLPDLFNAIAENARCEVSNFDVVAVNMPWVGELVTKGALLPLDDYIESSRLPRTDFHPSVWSMGAWGDTHFGIPLYCTVEMLAARDDLFDRDGVRFPATLDDTVDAARHFHDPKRNFYGIVWNGAEGMPIASTFMILMACCGQTILNLPKGRMIFTADRAHGDQLRPRVVSEEGFEVLDYLHRLIEVSPPDILEMGWDERTNVFLNGRAALGYCWSVRAARFENDIVSMVKRKVRYLQHPRGRHGVSHSPIGGFLLAIPANVPQERARLAYEAISWMTSPDAMRAQAHSGALVAPRFSVATDPSIAAPSPIVSVVDGLAKRNLLRSVARPSVPGYQAIEDVLGRVIHEALRGEISDRQALETAQEHIDRTMRDLGHY